VGKNQNLLWVDKVDMNIKEFELYNGSEIDFLNALSGHYGESYSRVVVTPNLDFWMRAQQDKYFYDLVRISDYKICDGMPLLWVMKLRQLIYGQPAPSRITGSEIMPRLFDHMKMTKAKFLIIGGKQGVAEAAKKNIMRDYGYSFSSIKAICPSFCFEESLSENDSIISKINAFSPNYIFVCLGSPKQEYWIHSNKHKINFDVALCVGAAVDFQAGSLKRAPKLFQFIGMEWFWRLSREPKRLFKRYFLNGLALIPLFIKSMKR
jgi:N-acetylglucosaminyldiphosphoundecaprenol N-acetyl-beta-D-mannosaminyltransferase